MQTISIHNWTLLQLLNWNAVRRTKKVFVSFNKDETNGLKRDCVVITPCVRNDSIGIRLINEKGRGWMEVKDWDTSEDALYFRFGLFMADDTLADTHVTIDFTFWDRTSNWIAPIASAQLSVLISNENQDPSLVTKTVSSQINQFLL